MTKGHFTSRLLTGLLFTIGPILMSPSSASANGFYPPYWGIDGALTYTVSGYVTIPTGYWGNGTTWLGWGPFNGWVTPAPFPFPWLDGWGGLRYPYFRDLLTYRWSQTRTLYKYSYYFDPSGSDYAIDITGFANAGGIEPLSTGDLADLSETSHIFSADPSGLAGSFTPDTPVADDAADIENYLLGLNLGIDPADAAAFATSDPMTYAESQSQTDSVLLFEVAVLPEPGCLALLAAGVLGMMRRPSRR